MRSRPNHLLRNLLYTTLLILAAMHPDTAGTLAQLAAGMVLATVNGVAAAAAEQPEAALLTTGLVWIAHQIRTHRPAARRPAHARH